MAISVSGLSCINSLYMYANVFMHIFVGVIFVHILGAVILIYILDAP